MKHIKLFEEFIAESDKVKGGMSDGMTLSDIAKHHGIELAELEAEYDKGLKVEMEHTSDNEIAAEIARDHLYEDPKYYTKLATIESVVNEAEKAKGDRGPLKGKAVETGLKNKSKESGVPIGILRIIMRRGMDAWNSGHHPGMTQEGWGYARVNAFLEKGKGTWGGADKDVAKEVRDGGHDKKLPYKFKED